MKFGFIVFLLALSFSYSCLSEDKKNPEFKSTSETLRELKISDKDICEVACESGFSKCMETNKKEGIKCSGEVVVCKNKCK